MQNSDSNFMFARISMISRNQMQTHTHMPDQFLEILYAKKWLFQEIEYLTTIFTLI